MSSIEDELWTKFNESYPKLNNGHAATSVRPLETAKALEKRRLEFTYSLFKQITSMSTTIHLLKARIKLIETGISDLNLSFARDIIKSCQHSLAEGPVTVKRMTEFSFESHARNHGELQEDNRNTVSMKSFMSVMANTLDLASEIFVALLFCSRVN